MKQIGTFGFCLFDSFYRAEEQMKDRPVLCFLNGGRSFVATRWRSHTPDKHSCGDGLQGFCSALSKCHNDRCHTWVRLNRSSLFCAHTTTLLLGPPRCCEKTSEATFRTHIRILKAKQITPEGPATLFYNIIGLAIVLSRSADRISEGRHVFASVACSGKWVFFKA